MEAVHHDGTGGDNLAVTYKLTAEPDPAPGAATRIITEQLAPYAEGLNGATLNITNFVQNVSGTQSRTASLTVGAVAGYQGDASGAAPTIAYQWQAAPAGSSAFTNIPGATAASYTTPLLTLGNQGTQYRVKLWAGDLATNTATTTLNVTPDTTAPTVAEVTSVNAGFNTIGLSFSELLDLASTETAANYSFGAGTVTNAVLDASGSNVTLKVSAPLSANTNLTLTINGVKDLAGNATAGVTLQFSFKAVTYRENILFDGPLAYYRFEETSGSVVTNSGSAGGNGVYYTGDEAAPNEGGTPASAKGDAGPRPPEFAGFDAANKSATFTGPDLGQEWIDTKNRYLDHRAAFSLEYWVRPVGRTNGGVAVWPGRVGIVGQNDAIEYGFISPGTIQIWTPAPNSGSLDTPYNFPDDEWHHVATIADGTAIRTYYDGALQGTSTGNNTDYGSSIYNVHIGGGGVFDATGNYSRAISMR
ncbi:MAG: LamG-like jellyroll fold domain-containing protein [Verrucomicrobiota bacterium]